MVGFPHPHWFIFTLLRMFFWQNVYSKSCQKIQGGSGCSASSPGPGMQQWQCLCWGQKPPSPLDILSVVCLSGDGENTGSDLGWDVGGSGGRGSGMTEGTFLVWGSASGLSRLYQRVINWQSAGLRFGNQSILAQKQPGEKNVPGIHLRWPLEGRKTSLKENKCFTVVFQTSSI